MKLEEMLRANPQIVSRIMQNQTVATLVILALEIEGKVNDNDNSWSRKALADIRNLVNLDNASQWNEMLVWSIEYAHANRPQLQELWLFIVGNLALALEIEGKTKNNNWSHKALADIEKLPESFCKKIIEAPWYHATEL